MNANVTISIDDLHPEEGWGCEGDESVGYLEELNKEFGCKFTLFIPSNYHNKYPLSEHKDWVEFWKKKDWVELAAHGHYHSCESKEIGECEFLELDYTSALDRINQSYREWGACNHTPSGFRMPGWLCNMDSARAIGEKYNYIAIHPHLNDNVQFATKVIKGADSIHAADKISIWDNKNFMFQSHIAGNTNENNWEEKNYLNFRNILTFLEKSYKLSYKTIGEI